MSAPQVYVLTRLTVGGDIREIRGVFLTQEGACEYAQGNGPALKWTEHNAHGVWWESNFDDLTVRRESCWTIEEMELRQ